MSRYRIITLIDITRSNPNRDIKDHVLLSQQANFNSLVQAIGLRSNLSWDVDPIKTDGTLPEPFEGRAACWIWEFETEQEEVFRKDDDPVGLLADDLHGVPIITDLEETIDIDPQIFNLKSKKTNTFLTII